VESILVVGIDTVVGANLAAHLADTFDVTGLAPDRSLAIDGCRTHTWSPSRPREAAQWIGTLAPDHVVYCGPESRSAWDPRTTDLIGEHCPDAAAHWAQTAAAAGCRFTMISSDAVFTGPWMFHDEESAAICRSEQAACIRAAETQVRQACPAALVARTNAFGFSPDGDHGGWVESLLNAIEHRRVADCDCLRHATPLLATDLADILERAWQEGLTGIHHVAGAERVNPQQFAQRLAHYFDLPWLSLRREEALLEPAAGFGAGESSLQTKKIRKALCVAMPMLSEGLSRLRAQQLNGHRDRICPPAAHVAEKVA
jgi:dTDP-4-dehydrorhamnose reductase